MTGYFERSFFYGLFFHLHINFAEVPTISFNLNCEVKDKVQRSPKLRKTFNLLSLSFYQHVHLSAIIQARKIMRLEFPFGGCDGATQRTKCPGLGWKVICEHVCNSNFLSAFSISKFSFGTESIQACSAQNQPDPEPPQKGGAGSWRYPRRGASRHGDGPMRSSEEPQGELWRLRFAERGVLFSSVALPTSSHPTSPPHLYLLPLGDLDTPVLQLCLPKPDQNNSLSFNLLIIVSPSFFCLH